MIVKWQNKMVMDAASGDGAGGGGQSGNSGGSGGSLFTPPASGGTPPANSGNANSAQGANQGSGQAGNSGNNNDPAGSGASDWRSALPKELQEDATLKKFSSVHALAGSYLNAQKLIGADKIPVPGKHTTEEDWKNIFLKLGVPADVKDYQVKFKDGISMDQKFSDDFRTQAHKLGILPKQAQALADWFSDVNLGSEQAVAAERDKSFQATVANLQKEWGNAFQLNVTRTNKLINELGGNELVNHFNALGLGGDEKVFKFLAKIAEEKYAEDKVVGKNGGAGKDYTPAEIKSKIAAIQANPAYYEKDHAQHKVLVDEMRQLHEELYSPKK